MNTRLFNKFKYLWKIFKNYENWVLIVINLALNKPILELIMRNGLLIVGGSKSLILDIADEIFIQQIYTPSYLKIEPGDVVMDIGANVGIFSLYAIKQGSTCVYSIEPLRYNIASINKNFAINNLQRPTIINKAVSNITGTSAFLLGDFDSHGRIVFNKQQNKIRKVKMIKTIKLADILKKYNISKINFLKIDCEGEEGKILAALKKNDWDKISKISLEYHDNLSMYRHQDIAKLIKNVGFKVKVKKIDNYLGYIYAWKENS